MTEDEHERQDLSGEESVVQERQPKNRFKLFKKKGRAFKKIKNIGRSKQQENQEDSPNLPVEGSEEQNFKEQNIEAQIASNGTITSSKVASKKTSHGKKRTEAKRRSKGQENQANGSNLPVEGSEKQNKKVQRRLNRTTTPSDVGPVKTGNRKKHKEAKRKSKGIVPSPSKVNIVSRHYPKDKKGYPKNKLQKLTIITEEGLPNEIASIDRLLEKITNQLDKALKGIKEYFPQTPIQNSNKEDIGEITQSKIIKAIPEVITEKMITEEMIDEQIVEAKTDMLQRELGEATLEDLDKFLEATNPVTNAVNDKDKLHKKARRGESVREKRNEFKTGTGRI